MTYLARRQPKDAGFLAAGPFSTPEELRRQIERKSRLRFDPPAAVRKRWGGDGPYLVKDGIWVPLVAGGSLGGSLPARIAESTGTTYYVDASSGSDSNPGTIGSPWQTINKARTMLSTASGGDKAYLRGGNYTAALGKFTTAGSASGVRTIESYPGETAVVKKGINIGVGASYWRFRNLVVDGTGWTSSDLGCGIKYQDNADHCELYNVTIRNCILGGTEASNPSGLLVYGTSTNTTPGHLHAYNCRFHDNGRAASSLDHGAYIGTGPGHVLANCIAYANSAYGIQIYPECDAPIIANCLGYGNLERSGIVVGGESSLPTFNAKVKNGIWCSNAWYGFQTYWGGSSGASNLFDHNLSYNNTLGTDSVTGATVSNTLTGNPLFVNAGAADFHLSGGSPALGVADPSFCSPLDADDASR